MTNAFFAPLERLESLDGTVRLAVLTLLLTASTPGAAQSTAPVSDDAARGTAVQNAALPTGLVVGSGNFYSPIVADLEEAIAFYRAVGFQFDGEPATADENPRLRAMFGLPDARLRWQTGRVPPTPSGVQIVEVSRARGTAIELDMQDPGAVMLMVVVRDIDATLARLKDLGAPVVTKSGAPVPLAGGPQGPIAVVVKDPAGHFVELVQVPAPPPGGSDTNIVGVRVRHTVENLESALALYRDALGLLGPPQTPPYVAASPPIIDLLGLPQDVELRFANVVVAASGLGIELLEFRGARRPAERLRVADPGVTRIQLRVADVDAAAAAVIEAGGAFITTGGEPVNVPAGDSTLEAAMVRDPDGLFLVLMK